MADYESVKQAIRGETAEEQEEEELEPENPDAEPEEGEEEEEEAESFAEPPEPASDVAVEVIFRKLEVASRAHMTRVTNLLHDSGIVLDPCPCCQFPGWVAPFNPQEPADIQRKAGVDAYFGAHEPNYLAAMDSRRCSDCDGFGEVLSGSKSLTHRLRACPSCSGMGWVSVAVDGLTTAPGGYPAPGVANGSGLPVDQVPRDAWGRPAGHPHFGMLPELAGT